MTVLLAGSGSVGHMSPVVSIARQLIEQDYDVILATDKGSQFTDVFESVEHASLSKIPCGKYRRYPGMKISPQYRVKIVLDNAVDLIRTFLGVISSLVLIKKRKPDAIFLKGGAISVPLGVAARMLGVPFVTHDSDTIPGLSNRVVGRWAVYNLVNGPIEDYSYPDGKSIQVGIPLRSQFRDYVRSNNEQKNDWDVLFIGGSQGSVAINNAAAAFAEHNQNLSVANLCGRGNCNDDVPSNLRQIEYIDNPAKLISSSRLVVARSSATFVAELAALSKTCIFTPHPGLADQKSNAKLIESKGAGRIVHQADDFIEDIISSCVHLLTEPEAQFNAYGDNLNKIFASEDATDKVVSILSDIISGELNKGKHGQTG